MIELVLLYAKEYCSNLPNVLFCRNTIVVTAMTGVTATLILLCGETTHSEIGGGRNAAQGRAIPSFFRSNRKALLGRESTYS